MRFISIVRQLWLTMEKWVKKPIVQWMVGCFIFLLTAICLFQPDIKYLRWISTQTVQLLLVWLSVGVFFLLLRSKMLSFLSLGACAILCLFLKHASNLSLTAIQRSAADIDISILHCNTSEIQNPAGDDLEFLLTLDKDLVIFQEYTPQWSQIIPTMFDSIYQYKFEILRLDNYGQLILSKYPIVSSDTLIMQDIPIAVVTLSVAEGKQIQLIGHYNYPPISAFYRNTSRKIFSELSDYIRQSNIPVLYVGTINNEPWNNDLVKFRYNGFLNDSRKGFFPKLYDGGITFFEYPVDHIFYNQFWECLEFKRVENSKSRRLGIRGEYILKADVDQLESNFVE